MNERAFPFFYDWCIEMQEIDGELFKRFVLALSEYCQTKDKTVFARFKGLQRAYLLSLIHRCEQEGV